MGTVEKADGPSRPPQGQPMISPNFSTPTVFPSKEPVKSDGIRGSTRTLDRRLAYHGARFIAALLLTSPQTRPRWARRSSKARSRRSAPPSFGLGFNCQHLNSRLLTSDLLLATRSRLKVLQSRESARTIAAGHHHLCGSQGHYGSLRVTAPIPSPPCLRLARHVWAF